ncbi:MAG: hypothetical protein HEQ40_06095 [Lacibacter sp.]
MQHLILKYLATHGFVSIKGWGSMQLKETTARVDFPNKLIHAPVSSVEFSVNTTDETSFIDWLIQEQHLSAQEAQQQVLSFISRFREQVEKGTVQWNGLGSFKKSGHSFSFEQETNPLVSHQSVAAEKIIRSGATHQVLVGNEEHTNLQMEELLHSTSTKQKYSRLIPALFLAITGIILAVIFAKNHNIQWKNYTNYQPLQPKEPPVLHKTP